MAYVYSHVDIPSGKSKSLRQLDSVLLKSWNRSRRSLKPSVSTYHPASIKAQSVSLPSRGSSTSVVFPLDLKLDVIADCLDLPALPFSPADEIAKEKSLTEKDQRHQ
jgi:hypothetical protein